MPITRFQRLTACIPGIIKSPLRRVLGKPHPHGLCESEKRRLASVPSGVETTTRLFDSPWKVPDAPSFLSAHLDIFVNLQYQFRTTSTYPRVIDAGANTGLASLYFALTYPGAIIEAYEPDPYLCQTLKENLSHFAQCDSIEVHEAAIWSSDGELAFRRDGADGGSLSSEGDVIVPTVALTGVLQRRGTDFLKLDIEGAEVDVIISSLACLDQVNSMIVEYHGESGGKPRLGELLRILEEAGFRYFLETCGVHNPHPLRGIRQKSRFEFQTLISAIRD